MAFTTPQQIVFRKLVAAAWAVVCQTELVSPKDKAAKEEWYRRQLHKAVGVDSTTKCSHRSDFVPAMAHFEQIVGADIYWQTRLQGDDVRRRQFALNRLMTDRNIEQEYVVGIARQMFDTNNLAKLDARQVEAVITALKKNLGIYPGKLKLRRVGAKSAV